MSNYRRLVILSCSDTIDRMNVIYGLDPNITRDLVDLVILCTWDAVLANGIEWIHGENAGRQFISPEYIIEEATLDMVTTVISPDNSDVRQAYIDAALNVYREIPHLHYCMDAFLDIDAKLCYVHWKNRDVYVGFR